MGAISNTRLDIKIGMRIFQPMVHLKINKQRRRCDAAPAYSRVACRTHQPFETAFPVTIPHNYLVFAGFLLQRLRYY